MSASITDVANAANTTNSTVANLTNPTSSSSIFATAPLNPAFVAYINNKAIKPQVIGGHGKGIIPSPVDLSHISPIFTPLSFPAVYDLRTLNKVTPVKDQGQAGSCWTFSTYGSLESYLTPTQQWSFSENNMKNLLSSAAPQGFDRGPEDGGSFLMSTAYLSRWSGPVKTSDDLYSDISVYSPAELGMPIQKHIQNVYFLPPRQNSTDNNQIKSALQTYGAVATSMYYEQVNPLCFNTATNSYYDNVAQPNPDHGVTIVGWNDNYNKQNFSIVPPGNGAFIVKNSWSTAYGDNGYFYVSYYDPNFATYGSAVFTAENTNNYKNIYQYDPLGWVNNIGSSSGTNPTCWGANVFTATSNDPLEAVSFYTTDSNCNYNLYIGSSNLASRTLVQSGTIPMSGYHTIPLSSAIPLITGQKFSVIITLTFPNPNPTNPNDYYPMVVEEPYSGFSSKAIANASESFISLDGNSWTDMTAVAPNTDICIKAFTVGVQPILPVANFIASVTSDSPLTVQFTDQSKNATEWNWDFGDGASSILQNPVHTYNAQGTFTVTLNASNANGSNSKSATINVSANPALVFPDCTNLSKDLNGDDLYEDINGNGRMDFADVVIYFNNMAWIPQHEPVSYFDYNHNGRIDFSDVVMLFNIVGKS